MILGAHESIAGGLPRAVERAVSDGARAFQIFCASSRSWRARAGRDDEDAQFRRDVRRARLGPLAAHACYLINLAAPRGPLRRRSNEAFVGELRRCEALGLQYLIVHPGSHGGAGESEGVGRIARALDDALEEAPAGVTVLLENTAGQGASVGHDFRHLRDIIGSARCAAQLGVCLDTQHAFAAGYDLRTAEGYERTFAALHAAVDLERLRAFHLNDSKRPLGERVDRHENIGAGHLGIAPFRRLVNDRRFRKLPGYLETQPYATGSGPATYQREIALLRSLARR